MADGKKILTAASGKFPKWDVKIQVMTEEETQTFRWNPFDVTKIWP